MNTDVLVVGAGFAGCVIGRELADEGHSVIVVERRAHLGGNAYDEFDTHGLLIHRYGPHIFHTNNDRVIRWLSRFTDWRFYEHRVLAQVAGQLLPIPINRTTLNRLYSLNLDERGAAEWFERVRELRSLVHTSEDVVLSSIGRDLCDKFFRGYTRKQWGLDLSELNAAVAARIPTRFNDDDRYFTDAYQFMPLKGYTCMFQRMLAHPNIRLHLSTDYLEVRDKIETRHTVYTGPIDAFYGWRLGKLPYRSLRFEHKYIPNRDYFQIAATVNYPNDHDYTRITEFKYLTGQQHSGTSVVYEYPQAVGDPYYPIPRQDNDKLYQRYKALADAEPNVTFIGRLAEYRYYNMDQVVETAIRATQRVVEALKHE